MFGYEVIERLRKFAWSLHVSTIYWSDLFFCVRNGSINSINFFLSVLPTGKLMMFFHRQMDRQPRVSFTYKLPLPILHPWTCSAGQGFKLLTSYVDFWRRGRWRWLAIVALATSPKIPSTFTFQSSLVHCVMLRKFVTENVDGELWYMIGGRLCR